MEATLGRFEVVVAGLEAKLRGFERAVESLQAIAGGDKRHPEADARNTVLPKRSCNVSPESSLAQAQIPLASCQPAADVRVIHGDAGTAKVPTTANRMHASRPGAAGSTPFTPVPTCTCQRKAGTVQTVEGGNVIQPEATHSAGHTCRSKVVTIQPAEPIQAVKQNAVWEACQGMFALIRGLSVLIQSIKKKPEAVPAGIPMSGGKPEVQQEATRVNTMGLSRSVDVLEGYEGRQIKAEPPPTSAPLPEPTATQSCTQASEPNPSLVPVSKVKIPVASVKPTMSKGTSEPCCRKVN